MKFIVGLGLCTVAMFGSIFMVQANHFDDQKMACKRADGRGSLVVSRATGIPIGYECMRMHLVLKYRNGEYR